MGLIKITGGGVIENVGGQCDGRTITFQQGSSTLENVTTVQNLGTSYVDFTGSVISYTPPPAAKAVIYEFIALQTHVSTNNIHHIKFYIDSDEVTEARTTESGGYEGSQIAWRWEIPIGGTANTATGRLASWTTSKTLKLQIREYGSSNQGKAHQTTWWDGDNGTHFHRPSIYLTALS